jgi:hypothetical protein
VPKSPGGITYEAATVVHTGLSDTPVAEPGRASVASASQEQAAAWSSVRQALTKDPIKILAWVAVAVLPWSAIIWLAVRLLE